MKTSYIILFIAFIALAGLGYFILREDTVIDDNGTDPRNDLQEMNLRIEFIPEEGIESQEIRVLNDDNDIIFQLTIDELNQWTQENWDVFEETPEIGGVITDPESFNFFDRAASISPNNQKMVFSVSHYALATTLSFVIVVDLDSGGMEMVTDPAKGDVEDYFWSEDYDLIAYLIGTGRARGDFLLVDSVSELRRNFTLEGRDIAEILDPDEDTIDFRQFMPKFRELQWIEGRLYFTTDHPEDDQARWSIDRDGTDLRVESY